MKSLFKRYIRIATACFLTGLLLFTSSCEKEEESPIYTIIVESNGGTNFAPIRVLEGDTIPSFKLYPSPIISDGGTFVGWYSDKELENEYDFATPVNKDMVLYAKWFYVTHTVSFVMNGAPEKEEQQIREGTQADIENPEYEGHIFTGWYEDAELTKLYDPNMAISEDLILYARWMEPSPASWFSIDADGVLIGCNPPEGIDVVVIPEGTKVIPAWFVLANGLNEPDVPGFPTGKNISEFILPESLEVIGMGAFKHAAIKAINIPPKVKVLEPTSFMECNQLTSFTFSKGSQLEEIKSDSGNSPVISSSSLESISFPPSLQYVGKYTLAGCSAMKTITFERSESPVIFNDYLPGGGVWLWGGHFPSKIRVPNSVKEAFITEMRKVMQDYEFDNMSTIVEGY